jgi:hypothetical protein
VTGVVDDDVDASCLREDCGHGAVDRRLLRHIHLDGPQCHRVRVGVAPGRSGGLGISASNIPHTGVDNVFGVGEGADRHGAESARRAGDENDFGRAHLRSLLRWYR